MPAPRSVDFRVNHSVPHDCQRLGSVRYRAGFEDWDDPGAFVVQLEEATGYSRERGSVAWSPIARFDHLRPHDIFDPEEGVHLDVYRRDEPGDCYETISVGVYPRERDPQALFYFLQELFEIPANVNVLLRYYTHRLRSIDPDCIRFHE